MRRTSFAEMSCSIARSLELVGEWWSPLILRDLAAGLRRFDDLVADLGCSRNVLATRLADLVEAGLVERVAYAERPARFEYRLTAPGAELVPLLFALAAWGDRWVPPDGGPAYDLRHDGCGHGCRPVVACSSCAAPLEAGTLSASAGPGLAATPGNALLAERLASGPTLLGTAQTT